jgi:hypothetical protein
MDRVKYSKEQLGKFLVIFLLISLCGSRLVLGTYEPEPALERDAVYLLDVSTSMVGKGEGRDILDSVIQNILIPEIDNFQRGYFILVFFQNGPYDFYDEKQRGGHNPNRCIKSKYEIYIDSQFDPAKLQLKRVLDPQKFGVVPECPNWPGVYKAVKDDSGHSTAIYKTLEYGLQLLEELQKNYPQGSENYAQTRYQELILLTDGIEHVSGLPFDKIMQLMDLRSDQTRQHFFYRRIFFGKPPLPKEIPEECKLGRPFIECPTVEPGKERKLYQIQFLPPVIEFLNAWRPDETTLENRIELASTEVTASVHTPEGDRPLRWGQTILGIDSTTAALPDNVMFRLEPESVSFPLSSFQFKLLISPYSSFKEWMDLQNKSEIEITLRRRFQPQSSPEGFVEITGQNFLKLRYQRPELNVDWDKTNLVLNLKPNKTLQGLSDSWKKVIIRCGQTDGKSHFVECGNPIPIMDKISLTPNPELPAGRYNGVLKVCPEANERAPIYDQIIVNGQKSCYKDPISTSYEFYLVEITPSYLKLANLWGHDIVEGKRKVCTDILRIEGGPADWGKTKLKLNFKGLTERGIQVSVLPNTVMAPFNEQKLSEVCLEFAPYTSLRSYKKILNENQSDGELVFQFDAVDPEQPVVTFRKREINVDLEFRELFIRSVTQEQASPEGVKGMHLQLIPSEDLHESREKQVVVNPVGNLEIKDEAGRAVTGGILMAGQNYLIMPRIERTAKGCVTVLAKTFELMPADNNVWLVRDASTFEKRQEYRFPPTPIPASTPVGQLIRLLQAIGWFLVGLVGLGVVIVVIVYGMFIQKVTPLDAFGSLIDNFGWKVVVIPSIVLMVGAILLGTGYGILPGFAC